MKLSNLYPGTHAPHISIITPNGIHDLANNAGWVKGCVQNDTGAFAVQTIRRWRQDVRRVR